MEPEIGVAGKKTKGERGIVLERFFGTRKGGKENMRKTRYRSNKQRRR